MRHWYVDLTEAERHTFRFLRKMMAEPYGYDISRAAYYADIPVQRAHILLARGKTSRLELKQKRKDYIVAKMSDKTSVHRNSMYMLACFFNVDEDYVMSLVKELRDEGRLPPADDDSKEGQEEILKILRKHYPNVFRAETVKKEKEHPNKIFVAGKGWMSWPEAKSLSELLKNKGVKT